MKYIFLLLFISSNIYAQDTLLTYFNSNWDKIENVEEMRYYRKSFKKNDKYYYIDFYSSGIKQNEGSFLSDKQKIKDGTFIYYSEQGKITSIKIYKLNERDGIWHWYHANGLACSKEKYLEGELLELKYYNEQGQIIDSGKQIQYPTYKSGQDQLLSDILKILKYPLKARENGIEGSVIISFLITPEGQMKNPVVKRSIHSLLDEEALRVVKTLKNWSPGKAHNQFVEFEFSLPIIFKLEEKEDK